MPRHQQDSGVIHEYNLVSMGQFVWFNSYGLRIDGSRIGVLVNSMGGYIINGGLIPWVGYYMGGLCIIDGWFMYN